MKINKDTIIEIIGDNCRFISPYHDTDPYVILNDTAPLNEDFDVEIINKYYERLRYAVSNADNLIKEAFNDKFYDVYFIDKSIVKSPAQMCSELIFDSFVMFLDNQTVSACFSNDTFMFGDFIDVTWNRNWNIISVWLMQIRWERMCDKKHF